MLKLTPNHYAEIRRHGEETYPHECCGVLLGSVDDAGARIVTSTARCGNTRTDSPHNRYNIDPKDLIRVEKEAREQGVDVIGYYHSHPDHPARWSQTDLNEAHWPGYSYVITQVANGKAEVTNSFELVWKSETDKTFVDERVEVGD
jgi:proteasome lid subunit RPN8/RPN11